MDRTTRKEEGRRSRVLSTWLFGVHMVPTYGEGDNAWSRLVKKVCKKRKQELSLVKTTQLRPDEERCEPAIFTLPATYTAQSLRLEPQSQLSLQPGIQSALSLQPELYSPENFYTDSDSPLSLPSENDSPVSRPTSTPPLEPLPTHIVRRSRNSHIVDLETDQCTVFKQMTMK
jgi:hypothetical protein